MTGRFVAATGAGVVAMVLMGCGASGFCASHRCVSGFDHDHGSIVQCADGEWSDAGGRQAACSDHGGERTSGTDTSGPSGGGPRNGTGLTGTFGGG